jgi:hypothetical protein
VNPDRPNRYRDFLVRAIHQREWQCSVRRRFVVGTPLERLSVRGTTVRPDPRADMGAPGLLTVPVEAGPPFRRQHTGQSPVCGSGTPGSGTPRRPDRNAGVPATPAAGHPGPVSCQRRQAPLRVRAAIARPLLDQSAVAVIGAAKAGSPAIPPDVAARWDPRSPTNTDISPETRARMTVLPVSCVPDAWYVGVCRRKPPRSNLAQTGHRPGRAGQRPGYRTAAARAPVAGTLGEPIYPDDKVDFRLRPPAMCVYLQSADRARIRLPPLVPGGTCTTCRIFASWTSRDVLSHSACERTWPRKLLGNLLSDLTAQPIEPVFQQRRRPWSADP